MKFKLATYSRFRERIADVEEPENFAFITNALWRTLLVFVALSALVSVAYGLSLVRDVLAMSDASNTTVQNSMRSNPDRVALETIVAGFVARKDHHDTLQAQPISAPDPSQ